MKRLFWKPPFWGVVAEENPNIQIKNKITCKTTLKMMSDIYKFKYQNSHCILPLLYFSYQSGTVICMYKAISDACGAKVANLSLGQAMEELAPSLLNKGSSNKQKQKSDQNEAIDILEGKLKNSTMVSFADAQNDYETVQLKSSSREIKYCANFMGILYKDITWLTFVSLYIFR